jgi:hypothetical protein
MRQFWDTGAYLRPATSATHTTINVSAKATIPMKKVGVI